MSVSLRGSFPKKLCLTTNEFERNESASSAINNHLVIQTHILSHALFNLIVSYGNFVDFIAWRKVTTLTRRLLKFEQLNSSLLRPFYETVALHMISHPPSKIQLFPKCFSNPPAPYKILYSKAGRMIGVKSIHHKAVIINDTAYWNHIPFYPTENGYQCIDLTNRKLVHYCADSSSPTSVNFVSSSSENPDIEFRLLKAVSHVIMHEERNCFYILNFLDQQECAILSCWNFSKNTYSKVWEAPRVENVRSADKIGFFKIGTHVFLRKLNQITSLFKQASIFHLDKGLYPIQNEPFEKDDEDQFVLEAVFASDHFAVNDTHFFSSYRKVNGGVYVVGVELLKNSPLQFKFSNCYKLMQLRFSEKLDIQIKANNKIVCVNYSLDSRIYETVILDARSFKLIRSLPNREKHIQCQDDAVMTTTIHGNERHLELYHARTDQKIKEVLSNPKIKKISNNPVIDLNFSLSYQPTLGGEITLASENDESIVENDLQVESFIT